MLICRWCCYVEDVDMLKMLICWRCSYIKNVDMSRMLLCWRCWYVEYDDMLKMLLHLIYVDMYRMLLCWRCWHVEDVPTSKMLIYRGCCYVEDVEDDDMLKMLLHLIYVDMSRMLICGCERKTCAFCPRTTNEFEHFAKRMQIKTLLWIRNSTGFYCKKMKSRNGSPSKAVKLRTT